MDEFHGVDPVKERFSDVQDKCYQTGHRPFDSRILVHVKKKMHKC